MQHPEVVTKAEGRTTDTTKIRHGDKPLTLVGPTLDVGAAAHDVTVVDANLQPVKLSALKGRTVVLSVVPSIDTRVSENQTLHLSQAMDQLPAGVEVMTGSRYLPFAQSRFAQDPSIKTKMVSDYKGGELGLGSLIDDDLAIRDLSVGPDH